MQEIKLVGKELKNNPRFSLLYSFTMFLGLVGLMIVGNFNESFKHALESRAKNLLTADIAVTSRRAFTEEENQAISEIFQNGQIDQSQMIEMYHMAMKVDGTGTRLVQIKAVDQSYPLIGKVSVLTGLSPFYSIHQGDNIVVDKDVLFQFKLNIGDKLKIGSHEFTISAQIDEDMSSSWRGISMAPKIYMGLDSMLKTGLMGVGTVASYYQFYRLAPNVDLSQLQSAFYKVITDPAIRLMTPDKASEQVGRVMGYLSDFLGLVSLVALFLSIIGVVYMGQSYFFERLGQIGILRSLGMPDHRIRMVYQLKLLVLALAAWISAYLFTLFAQNSIQNILIRLEIPFELQGHLSITSLLVTLVFVILISALIGSSLISKVFSIPTREILFGQKFFRWRWSSKDYLLLIPFVLVFWGLAIWQSQSLLVGSVFMGALIGTSLLLLAGFYILVKGLGKVYAERFGYPTLSISLGIRSVVRSPLNSAISMWAVGIGVMLLALITQIESGLQNELIDEQVERPSLFLFDIQPEQKEELQQFAKENNIPLGKMVPMVRARLTHINGNPFVRMKEDDQALTREDERERNIRNRGVNLTYEFGPNPSVSTVAGEPMPIVFSEQTQQISYIALETRYAKRLGIKIGDEMTFDILGVEVKGEVRELRRIRWTSFRPNFFISFQRGAIDQAPQTFLGTVDQMSPQVVAQIQDEIVENFPNISMINISDLVNRVMALFESMGDSIRLMAYLCILVGIIVITAINRNSLYKQSFEISLQKVLGLGHSKQLVVVCLNFIITTIAATLLGIFASIGASKVFSEIFFDGAWNFNLTTNATILAAMCILTLLTVVVSSWGILNKRPKVFLS